jgi:GLPGLI family protein
MYSMMYLKKILFYIILFGIVSVTVAQKKVNHVTYKVGIKDRPSLIGPIGAEEMELTLQAVENVKPELFYNDSISKFIVPINFEKDDPNELSLLILGVESGIIYSNKNSKSIFWKQTFKQKKQEYMVYKNYVLNWILEKESKIIQGEKCFKATAILYVDARDGEINQEFPLTAWYATTIKNDAAPNGYSGLPGLVLELELPLITYEAIALDYQEKYYDIKIPTEHNIISKSDYYKMF